MSERVLVDEMRATVCLNGHMVSQEPTGRKIWITSCPYCGGWGAEDANFCGGCGKRLKEAAE